MSDQTINAGQATAQRTARKPKAEFVVYFAIILVATLPLATLTWALTVLRTLSFDHKGPVARAWSQARIITPIIFSA